MTKVFNFKKELIKGNPLFEISDDLRKIEGFLYFEYDNEKHVPLTKEGIKKQKDDDIFFVKDSCHEREVIKKNTIKEFHFTSSFRYEKSIRHLP